MILRSLCRGAVLLISFRVFLLKVSQVMFTLRTAKWNQQHFKHLILCIVAQWEPELNKVQVADVTSLLLLLPRAEPQHRGKV